MTLTRHASLLRWGTKRLLDSLVEKIPDARDVGLWGRPELGPVTKETTHLGYNEKVYGPAFFVNARAKPTEGLLLPASWSEPFAATSGDELVAARLDTVPFRPGVVTRRAVSQIPKKLRRVNTPPEPLFRGYWDLIGSNGLALAAQARHFEETLAMPRGVEVKGPASNLILHAGAEVEGQVMLDARLGPIIIDSGAIVESFSRIMGPSYIGPKAKVYSALIGGGTSIFDHCKVGGQVDNSVLMPFTNKAHHGYIGDSYIGSWVNVGAGCTFSNLKNTYGNVRLSVSGKKVDSGMLKLGPAIGDMAKLSIGTMVYAGRMVGAGSHVSGVAGEDVPSFSFYDSNSGKRVMLLLESVIETQRRMMERRGMSLSRSEEVLIRRAFASTSKERARGGVKKGKLT